MHACRSGAVEATDDLRSGDDLDGDLRFVDLALVSFAVRCVGGCLRHPITDPCAEGAVLALIEEVAREDRPGLLRYIGLR